MMQCPVCMESFDDWFHEDVTNKNGLCPLCTFLVSRGLPEHYLRAKKSDFDGSSKRLFDGHESLFIYGGVGVGKTWLASALMREQARETAQLLGSTTLVYNDKTRFVSLSELAVMIRGTMNRSSEDSEMKILNRYGREKTLFFDDVGAENVTDFVRSTLYVLVERRNTMLFGRTVITSNLSLRELDKEYGPRVASRISEMCRVVNMTGVDRRVHK